MKKIEPNIASEEIEGLLFFEGNNWIAVFDVCGETFRCKIDYCPWCGVRLQSASDVHKH